MDVRTLRYYDEKAGAIAARCEAGASPVAKYVRVAFPAGARADGQVDPTPTPLFDVLPESVEVTTALQRGAERWAPRAPAAR